MKAILFILAAVVSAQAWAYGPATKTAATTAPATSPAVTTKTTAATTATTTATTTTTPAMTLKVAGMTCGSCEQSIEDQVGKVPGVKSCTADHQAGTVTIETDGTTPVDQAAVMAAIKKAGKQYVISK
jgi:copper chaperone CopZ